MLDLNKKVLTECYWSLAILGFICTETLVHSTLESCDNADFTFPVFFNTKEHTVYVRQRPFLQTFLDRVAEMFEVVVFTASQSIYAEQLLDILDPERKLISRRAYRESCIFSDGSYTKDLTVLGVDLAKVAIIDNSPQVLLYLLVLLVMNSFCLCCFIITWIIYMPHPNILGYYIRCWINIE